MPVNILQETSKMINLLKNLIKEIIFLIYLTLIQKCRPLEYFFTAYLSKCDMIDAIYQILQLVQSVEKLLRLSLLSLYISDQRHIKINMQFDSNNFSSIYFHLSFQRYLKKYNGWDTTKGQGGSIQVLTHGDQETRGLTAYTKLNWHNACKYTFYFYQKM